MAYWLSSPLSLHSGRDFDCSTYDGMTPEQCAEYERRWVYWFDSDHVYALPTVAFFMCTIGIFVIGYVISQLFGYSRRKGNRSWRRTLAVLRYLSYRGFHIKRLQWNSPATAVLLLAAVGTVYFLCMAFAPRPYYWPDISMDTSPPLGTRSGFLAVACMPFIFATASKANWITLVTGISHEKLIIFHRYISFAFFGLALLHSVSFVVYHVHFHDMVSQVTQVEPEEYWTGIVALVFQGWLTFASLSPIRKLGYEFFKFAHYSSATIFMLMFFWHCDGSLTSWDYFIATAAVYVPSLVYPWLRSCFEYGNRLKAQVSVEEHGTISISIPAEFDWVPVTPGKNSSMIFYARRRGGLTARLHSLAKEQPRVTGVSVDGPYGGIDLRRFHASDRILVIAGGSAAGWTLPFIVQFARLMAGSIGVDTIENRSMHVILATRDDGVRRWFLQAVRNVLSETPLAADSLASLNISVYLTSEGRSITSSSDDQSQSSGDLKAPSWPEVRETKSLGEDEEMSESQNHIESQQRHGRPHLPTIIHQEATKAANTVSSLGVYVCGPPHMQNDVRNAVARENLQILRGSDLGGSYLYCEHYSWA